MLWIGLLNQVLALGEPEGKAMFWHEGVFVANPTRQWALIHPWAHSNCGYQLYELKLVREFGETNTLA